MQLESLKLLEDMRIAGEGVQKIVAERTLEQYRNNL